MDEQGRELQLTDEEKASLWNSNSLELLDVQKESEKDVETLNQLLEVVNVSPVTQEENNTSLESNVFAMEGVSQTVGADVMCGIHSGMKGASQTDHLASKEDEEIIRKSSGNQSIDMNEGDRTEATGVDGEALQHEIQDYVSINESSLGGRKTIEGIPRENTVSSDEPTLTSTQRKGMEEEERSEQTMDGNFEHAVNPVMKIHVGRYQKSSKCCFFLSCLFIYLILFI